MGFIINIICDEAGAGWIYSEFIYWFKKYSKHEILINEKDDTKYDMIHFLPYYLQVKTSKPSTCWLSHQESKNPLHNKFITSAKSINIGISHNKKYATMLKDDFQCKNIVSIIPGVDTSVFTIRSQERPKNPKLVVGYVGRSYSSSNRKNPTMLKKISQLPFVDFRATNGNLKANMIPSFIQQCDMIVSPSFYEGGPMVIQQALSCGTPIQCFSGVGVANEFKWGVSKVKFGDSDEFIRQIEFFWDSEHYIDPHRDLDVMQKLRSQVEEQTWQKFVEAHDKIWSSLV